MDKKVQKIDRHSAEMALLKRELEAGLASGLSQRTPKQILAAFRKAREAA